MPDLIDCARLAEESAGLERIYELADLPRLQDLLVDPRGQLRASYGFTTVGAGRCGAEVAIEADPTLVCQRCMQACGVAVSGRSEIEFAVDDDALSVDPERELFKMRDGGLVSLRELAEEELLLALPRAFMCGSPLTCGRAPASAQTDGRPREAMADMRRPFSALRELLKKT